MEYALVLALFVVGTIFGMRLLEDNAGREANSKISLGAPDVQIPPGTTPTTVVGSTTTPITSPPLPDVAVRIKEPVVWAASVQGSKWTASVTVEVVRVDTGQPYAPAVTITGQWSGRGGDLRCETGVNGSCPLTITNLNNGDREVRFQVTGVSGSSVIPPASYPAEIIILKPTP